MKTPDKTAVIACDRILTYDQLNKQANRIAHSLINNDIKVGDIVAFALPRTSNLIVTMLGILKAGAAYLPIDPDYPQDRIDYMLADSKAKIYLTDENIEDFLKNNKTTNPSVVVSSNNLCYCIYTSGSTGLPKGTLILHRNVVNAHSNNCLYDYIEKYCHTVLACGSITFDISVMEIILPLLLNKSIVFSNDKAMYNPQMLSELLQKYNIDCAMFTPSKLKGYMSDRNFIRSCFHKVMKISFPKQ